MINLSLFSDQVADSHENSIYHSYTNHSYIHDTRSHNSGNIHGENLHILAIEREKSFLENWNIFSQKMLLHNKTYWATKYESWGENEFWATDTLS